MYEGGALVASAPTSTPAAQANSRVVLFGERAASTTYSMAGKIYFHASWNRRLSVAEIASISANPWQIFGDDATPIAVSYATTPAAWMPREIKAPSGAAHGKSLWLLIH